MSNLNDLISQAITQAQNARSSQSSQSVSSANDTSVNIRSSRPSTFGLNGNSINIRGSRSLSEGVDTSDGLIGPTMPISENDGET